MSDSVRSQHAAEADAAYWQDIVAKQEIAQSCQSREPGRLVIRHPPLTHIGSSGPTSGRMTCNASTVIDALLDKQAVELENVVLSGTLDLRNATTPTLQADLPLRRPPSGANTSGTDVGGWTRAGSLQQWLEERRRDHRVPDELPGQTRFQVIGVPIAIRNSQIDDIVASAENPMLFTEPIDLRGTRIGGPLTIVGAVFMEPVNFEGTDLLGDAAFTGTHFDAGVNLTRAHLGGDARFEGTTFGTRVLTRPPGRLRLSETRALFVAATFARAVSFRDAVFEPQADFRNATFAGITTLAAARFQRLVDFGHALFEAPVDASNTVFEADARFPSAVFSKTATFDRAEFRGFADFALASFADQGSTFRGAQFGPALFVPSNWAEAQSVLRRFWAPAGYDFRQTDFKNKARALARADFQVHWAFATVTVGLALLGLLLALATRRPGLVTWSGSDEPDVVAKLAVPRRHGVRARRWRGPASPRERLADGAYLIAAYGVLVVGLVANYQTQIAHQLSRGVIYAYPLAGFVVWSITMVAALNPLRLRSTRRSGGAAHVATHPPMLDYFNPAYHVRRRCDRFVHEFVARVSTGVLGLAGPRGAGRSTLARAVLEELAHPRGKPATTPAPILAVTMAGQAAGADLPAFFTVLFRRVGQQVQRELRGRMFTIQSDGRALPLATRRDDVDFGAEKIERAAEELIQPPPAITLLPLGVVACAVLFFLASPWWLPSPAAGPGEWTPWLLIASLGACAAFYYERVVRLLNLRRALQELPSGRLYMRTERALEKLAYEESTSEEREASVALPRGLSLRGRQSRSLKERPNTLPTMVDDFTRYVAALREIFDRGVVVHIDDADRIDDLKEVGNLILGLKGALVGGVLFLVPLPHTVLDSATEGPSSAVAGMLDDVIMVPPMTFDEAMKMLVRRRFFARDDAAVTDALQSRNGLGATMCLLAGGIPKEILRLLRRVSTDGRDWTSPHLVQLCEEETREGVRLAVQRAPLPAAVRQRLLDALDHGDDGTSVEGVATAADPPVTDAALLDMLRRVDARRKAVYALRTHLDELKVLEGAFVDRLAEKSLLGPVPPWLEQLHGSFAALRMGAVIAEPAA